MRKFVIAGNWKMNKSFEETDDYLEGLAEYVYENEDDMLKILPVVCPPAIYLEMATDFAEDRAFYVGAQDVSEHESGAFTGEISAPMYKSMAVTHCIVGHSERRKYHNETDVNVNGKIKALQKQEMIPIVCIGESEEERRDRKTEEVLERQLEGAFGDIKLEDGEFIIAYEPIWAIGTGKTATPDIAQEAHAFIRGWLKGKFGDDTANTIQILYGGSVNPGNIEVLLSEEDIDGALIGGASLDLEKYKDMLAKAVELTK